MRVANFVLLDQRIRSRMSPALDLLDFRQEFIFIAEQTSDKIRDC